MTVHRPEGGRDRVGTDMGLEGGGSGNRRDVGGSELLSVVLAEGDTENGKVISRKTRVDLEENGLPLPLSNPGLSVTLPPRMPRGNIYGVTRYNIKRQPTERRDGVPVNRNVIRNVQVSEYHRLSYEKSRLISCKHRARNLPFVRLKFH